MTPKTPDHRVVGAAHRPHLVIVTTSFRGVAQIEEAELRMMSMGNVLAVALGTGMRSIRPEVVVRAEEEDPIRMAWMIQSHDMKTTHQS